MPASFKISVSVKVSHFLSLIFLLLIGFASKAQKFQFDHLTTRDGLSQNYINCVFQDNDGFLWIGTFNGLNRYDAYGFKKYFNEANNPSSISHQSVNTVFQDKAGNIWVGTENGLNLYSSKLNNFSRFYIDNQKNSSNQCNDINTIYEDGDGILWIGFYGSGLWRFYPKAQKFEEVQELKNLNIKKINAFYADKSGVFWIGTEGKGLVAFNPKTHKSTVYCKDKTSMNDSIVSCIVADRNDNLWVGTWNGGLNKYSLTTKKFTTYSYAKNSKSPASNAVTSISIDTEGTLWLGTFGEGLNRFDTKTETFLQFKHEDFNLNSLSNNVVWTTFIDRSGVLWIGTYGGGLNKYVPLNSEFTSYRQQASIPNWLNNNTILSFCEGKDHSLYLGTSGGGVNIFDRKTQRFSYLLQNTEMNAQTIRCIFEDAEGLLWVGTDAGVFKFSATHQLLDHYKLSTKNGGLGSTSVYCISQDREKNLWFGSWNGGLHKLAADQVSKSAATAVFQYFDRVPFHESTIWCIYPDSEGDLWIGANRALYQYDTRTEKFTTYEPHFMDNQNTNFFSISCFYEDVINKRLWFGTLGNGIGLFDLKTKKFDSPSKKNEFANDEVFNIAPDRKLSFWVSSKNGIFRYDTKQNQYQVIALDRGHYSDEIDDRLWLLSTGEMLIGGNKGFYIFDPNRFFENAFTPEIVFTDFKVFNKSVEPKPGGILSQDINSLQSISLNNESNVFSIEFASLDFRAPENIKYEYKMEGFDQDWMRLPANNRSATYTNLNGGTYTFKVRATNSDGIWNDKEKSIVIEIIPPFYKSTWFRLLISCLLVVGFYLIYLFKVTILKEKILEKDKSEAQQQLKLERIRIEALSQEMEQKLGKHEREIATSQLYIQNKDESLLILRSQLLEMLEHAKVELKPKILAALNNVNKELKEQKGWDSFKENIDVLQNDLIRRLAEAFPELTQKDLKTCSYIALGKTNKEISDLLNISVKSVEMSRYRIRKKMNVDAKVPLNDFLIRF